MRLLSCDDRKSEVSPLYSYLMMMMMMLIQRTTNKILTTIFIHEVSFFVFVCLLLLKKKNRKTLNPKKNSKTKVVTNTHAHSRSYI